MKKVFTLLLLSTLLFQSCKIYDSKTASKEDALIFAGRVKVKSVSNSNYKFEKLIEEDNQLYGIGKRVSSKSKHDYLENIVNKNPTDTNVKILLTDDLVNEIHLYNRGKSSALNIIGIGYVTVLALGAVIVALLLSGI
ncbi:MAG: hypothetical protein ACI9OE_002196 [Mariniflexile sp.]|jgi:hypothetical protein